jgi:ribosomal protein S17
MEHKMLRSQSFTGVVIKAAMKDTATVRMDRYVKDDLSSLDASDDD